MRETKVPVQELWLKMGGGAYARGGRMGGILRYKLSNHTHSYSHVTSQLDIIIDLRPRPLSLPKAIPLDQN